MWDWPHLHQVESQSHRSGDGQHCIRDKCLFPDQLATGCWLSLGEICCTKVLLIIALTDSVILWSLVVCIEDLYWYRYWFLRRFLHFAYLVILSDSTLSEFTSKRSIHSRRWPKSFWTRMSKDIQHLKEKKQQLSNQTCGTSHCGKTLWISAQLKVAAAPFFVSSDCNYPQFNHTQPLQIVRTIPMWVLIQLNSLIAWSPDHWNHQPSLIHTTPTRPLMWVCYCVSFSTYLPHMSLSPILVSFVTVTFIFSLFLSLFPKMCPFFTLTVFEFCC